MFGLVEHLILDWFVIEEVRSKLELQYIKLEWTNSVLEWRWDIHICAIHLCPMSYACTISPTLLNTVVWQSSCIHISAEHQCVCMVLTSLSVLYRWIHTDFPWIYMDLHWFYIDFSLIYMDLHGFYLDLHGSTWIYMDLHSFYMDLRGLA